MSDEIATVYPAQFSSENDLLNLCCHPPTWTTDKTISKQLSKAEKRRRRRATPKYRHLHATRERIRVESFNKAFTKLRSLLPTYPPSKKLAKIEILRSALAYIKYLEFLVSL